MPDFYLQEGQRFEAEGADASVSEGTELTSSGSANTKGSYTQLVASTGFAASGLLVVLGGNGSNSQTFLTDLAIGAGGSEQILIPDLFYTGQSDGPFASAYFPVPVKAGQRLAARTASNATTAKHRILVMTIGGGFQMPSGTGRCTTYGADSGNSRGTSITSSASANTKGSWTQLSAATTAPMSWGVILAYCSSGSQFLFDIGVGASSSEQVLVSNLNIRASNSDVRSYAFPLRIPKGARVSARCAAASGTQTMRLILYGVG